MNISAASRTTNLYTSFKSAETKLDLDALMQMDIKQLEKVKPTIDIRGEKDSSIVAYITHEGNKSLPITAGQIRIAQESQLRAEMAKAAYKHFSEK